MAHRNLTQLQVEELQQAWKEMGADDREDIIRVLRHSTPSDVDALQAFLDAGGCNDNGALLITEADRKGRTTIPLSELREMSRKKVQ